jgi:hypothetical protein
MRRMNYLRGLIDRILLACMVVAGGTVPGFLSQYRQRLGGRLDQARIDLEPWQKIADQFYHGSLAQLIADHRASADPAIRSEGGVIEGLMASIAHLQTEFTGLQGDLFHQIAYLSTNLDADVARATLHDWSPTFGFSSDALLFAALFALAIWLLFQLLWWLVETACTRTIRRPARRMA